MPGTPNADEAAAIAAALRRFVTETAAPAADGQPQGTRPWHRAALLEGVGKRVTIEDLEGEGGSRWQS